MSRFRLMTLATAAALGFLSGCQSSSTSCNGNGSWFGRLCGRRNHRPVECCDAPIAGVPISSCSLGDSCAGGPMLGDPAIVNPGLMIPTGNHAEGIGPITTTIPGGQNFAVPGQGQIAPPVMPSAPPAGSLPTPTNVAPPLATVPGTNGNLATPVPAGPMARRR